MSEAQAVVNTEHKPLAERMRERVVQAVGDLLSQEELKQMCDAAIAELFFKGRPAVYCKPGDYNYSAYSNTVKEPAKDPLITEVAKQLVAPFVERAVQDYLAANHDKVMGMVKNVVDTGAEEMVLRAIRQSFNQPMQDMMLTMQQNLLNRANTVRQIIGYDHQGQPIYGG